MEPEARTSSQGWSLILYLATLLLELPGALVRALLVLLLAPLFLIPLGLGLAALPPGELQYFLAEVLWYDGPELVVILALLAGLGPLVMSLLTLVILPGGGWLTRWSLGAREPSHRERERLFLTLQHVASEAPEGTIAPTAWYVLDKPSLEAFVIGTTLYLSRDLLNSPYLAAVMAHELGHINSFDGRLTLSLRRLVLPPVIWISHRMGEIAPKAVAAGALLGSRVGCLTGFFLFWGAVFLMLAGGGIGLWLLSPLYIFYWRGREFAADRFAADCGQSALLTEFLQQHRLFFDIAVPYYAAPHPYVEHRIERLLIHQALHG